MYDKLNVFTIFWQSGRTPWGHFYTIYFILILYSSITRQWHYDINLNALSLQIFFSIPEILINIGVDKRISTDNRSWIDRKIRIIQAIPETYRSIRI